jgi:transcription elongation factor Elf1
MSYIDVEYVNLVSSRLDKFSRKKDNLYNFRCPYCGDSQRNKSKTRGYLYHKKNDVLFKCHNCGVGRTLANFLKDNANDLYDEYILKRYKEGLTGKATNTPNPKLEFETPKFQSNKSGVVPISILDEAHPAKKYLLDRKIPQQKLSKLYFCPKYKEWVNTQKDTFDDVTHDHPRIIIPLTNDGKWFGFQGRSLTNDRGLRYITTILDDSHPKIYNLDGVDYTKPVYITEGPIDSLFINNAIAMVGADIDWDFVSKSNTNFVFAFDNEPRNPQIVARMQKVIDKQLSIVIYPQDIKEKDINDMILAGRGVQQIVETSSYYGLEAQLKFNTWKKV